MTKITGAIGVTVLVTVFLQTAQSEGMKIPFQCQKIDNTTYCIGGHGVMNNLKKIRCWESDVICVEDWDEAQEIEKENRKGRSN